MDSNQYHKILNLLNISYDNRSIIYIIKTQYVRRRKCACFFGFYSRTNSFSSFTPENYSDRLHAWPEIKTLVFFRLLSSFLLSFFWLLQALFSWYYQ